MHIDPALSGDSLGMAMGYVDGWIEVERRGHDGELYTDVQPLIVVDFILKVAPGNEPIFLPDIRALLYEFMANGFHLIGFSTDQFQSAEMRQQMQAHGVRNVQLISVDRKTDPYEYLKAALYEGRVKMYRYEPLIEELERLEFDATRNKVDHPKNGSKDVADALAGMVYGLSLFTKRSRVGEFYEATADEGGSMHVDKWRDQGIMQGEGGYDTTYDPMRGSVYTQDPNKLRDLIGSRNRGGRGGSGLIIG